MDLSNFSNLYLCSALHKLNFKLKSMKIWICNQDLNNVVTGHKVNLNWKTTLKEGNLQYIRTSHWFNFIFFNRLSELYFTLPWKTPDKPQVMTQSTYLKMNFTSKIPAGVHMVYTHPSLQHL